MKKPLLVLAVPAVMLACCGVRESATQVASLGPELPPTPQTAYHVYVAQNGADSNPGTELLPFKTIGRAAQAALPDTTVHVAPGIYVGGFKTTANGSAKGRIYYLSTLHWAAKIVPPRDSQAPTAWDNRGNYVDIVGFDVDGLVYQGGIKWSNGIYSAGSYDIIRDNHVHDIAGNVACTSAGGSGIGVDSYYHGVQSEVIGNHIHDIGPAGCRYFQGVYINTPGKVINNVVYRVAEAGIHLWHDATNVIIANNTVTTSNSGIVVGGGDYYYTKGPNDHTAVVSNIVYDNRIGISEQGLTGKNNVYLNNLVFGNSGADWALASGMRHSGTVAANPQFLSYSRTGAPDFRLASNSPAIGKGSATHAYPRDNKGFKRNADTGYDIGAFQH